MFVYRNLVGPLAAAGHRVIVPDHLGFGRSDKPHDASLNTVSRHIERFDTLLESLDLHGATVVPQDWGGPHRAVLGGRPPSAGRAAHRPGPPRLPGRQPLQAHGAGRASAAA